MKRELGRTRRGGATFLRPLVLGALLLFCSVQAQAGETFPSWRLDVGTTFGMWGWDGDSGYPFKAGRGTVDAVLAYQLMDFGPYWKAQIGYAAGTIVSSEGEDMAEVDLPDDAGVQHPVSGPIIGMRYHEMVAVNLFFAHFTDGDYFHFDQYALGIMFCFNPHELWSWVYDRAFTDPIPEVGPPAPPVSFQGADSVAEGIWKRGY